MKKLITLSIIAIFLFGCSKPENDKGFVVTRTEGYYKETCKYYITTDHQKTAGQIEFWIIDDCGAWSVGDTLTLTLK